MQLLNVKNIAKVLTIVLTLLCYQRAILCYLEIPNGDFIIGYEQSKPHAYCMNGGKFLDWKNGKVIEVYPSKFRPKARVDINRFLYRIKNDLRYIN